MRRLLFVLALAACGEVESVPAVDTAPVENAVVVDSPSLPVAEQPSASTSASTSTGDVATPVVSADTATALDVAPEEEWPSC